MSAASTISRSRPILFQIAKVQELALQETLDESSSSNVERRVLDRIRKCLQRAQHPNTPEAEAQAAWRMTSRLMAQHNVTQADLIDRTANDNEYAALGGQSTVSITRTKETGAKVMLQSWVKDIAFAMKTFFDCDCYSTQRLTSIQWTFYGIATNTVAAAVAFEMAHNLILDWARSKTGRSAKNSYCSGVSNGLISIAKAEKRREERNAKEAEKETRQPDMESNVSPSAQIQIQDQTTPAFSQEPDTPQTTLDEDSSSTDKHNNIKDETSDCGSPNFFDSQSDDDEEETLESTFIEADEKALDLDIDLDEALKEAITNHAPMRASPATDTTKDNKEPQDALSIWHTIQALVKFRQSAEKVATEYLKAQNIKLGKARKMYGTGVKDREAFLAGKEDSKKIDLKRKRIENA